VKNNLTWGLGSPRRLISYDDSPFSKENLSVESGQKNAIKLFNELASRAYVTFMEHEMQKSVKDSNPWSIYYILIVGAEESGKSETVDYLCAKFIEKYFYKQVERTEIWTSVTSKFKDYLYTQIPEGKKFLFIAGEDLTGMKVIDEEESKRRRHKARERTGCDSGIIFDITCVHDIFAVNKLWRDAAGIIISKSAKTRATSPHAAIHQQYFLTKTAVECLNKADEYRNKIKKQDTEEKIAEYMLKYGHYYGYGAIWSKIGNKIDLWYNPKVNIPNNEEKAKEHNRTDYLYDLEYKREGDFVEEVTVIEHEWTDLDVFKWQEPLYKAMKASKKQIIAPPYSKTVSDYAEYFKVLCIEQLDPDSYDAEQRLGSKSTVNKQKRNALNGEVVNNGWRENNKIQKKKDKKRHPIFGWIINKRGEDFFENYVLFVLEELKGDGEIDINFHHKPKITVAEDNAPPNTPPRSYIDDIILYLDLEDKKNSIIVNLKCGEGRNSYPLASFKTTHLATTVGYQAAVLYYDVEVNLCLIFEEEVYAGDNIAVSGELAKNSGMTLTEALKTLAKRLNPSPTPKTTPQHKTEREKFVGVETVNQEQKETKTDV